MKVTQRWRPHLSAWYFSPLASSRGLDGLPWWLSGKESACPMQETQVRSLGQEDALEESMATHSSVLTWRIPWTEEPGGLQSMGSQRVRCGWSDLALMCAEGWTNRALGRWLAGGSSMLISIAIVISHHHHHHHYHFWLSFMCRHWVLCFSAMSWHSIPHGPSSAGCLFL